MFDSINITMEKFHFFFCPEETDAALIHALLNEVESWR